MRVTRHENLVVIDVDDTLVMWPEHYQDRELSDGGLPFTYYGDTVFLHPNEKHIDLLKSFKKRGFYVTVHSANGYEWAEHVVSTLMLTGFIDEVKTKPNVYVDDKDADEWMRKVYISE